MIRSSGRCDTRSGLFLCSPKRRGISVDVMCKGVYNKSVCASGFCVVPRCTAEKDSGCVGESMKKRRVLAAFLGVLAGVGAAVTLALGLTAPERGTVVLKMDPAAMERTQGFLRELEDMDLEGASAFVLGSPRLTAEAGEDGPERLLWDRYWQGFSCTAQGEPYAQGGNLAVDVHLSYPDIAAMTSLTGTLAEELLQEQIAQAESVSEIYDSKNHYRQELLDRVLLQAAQEAADQVTDVLERDVVLELTYNEGTWWIVPGNELRDLFSGAMGER